MYICKAITFVFVISWINLRPLIGTEQVTCPPTNVHVGPGPSFTSNVGLPGAYFTKGTSLLSQVQGSGSVEIMFH